MPTKPTKQELINGLAKTIEVDPDQIMIYKQTGLPAGHPTAYTVILKDYRKFTGILPDYALDEPDKEHLVKVNGVSLPAELVPYYTNPKDYPRLDLRDLAAYLEIPKARTLNKNVLIKKIKEYKAANKQEPITIEEANSLLFD